MNIDNRPCCPCGDPADAKLIVAKLNPDGESFQVHDDAVYCNPCLARLKHRIRVRVSAADRDGNVTDVYSFAN